MSAGNNSVGAFGDSQAVHSMLGSLWASITLESPAPAEQLDILLASFPTLPREVVAGGLATLLLCQVVGGVGSVHTSGLPQGWDSAVDGAHSAASMRRGELLAAFGRHFSLRDLFKLCARLTVSRPTYAIDNTLLLFEIGLSAVWMDKTHITAISTGAPMGEAF